MSQYLTQRRLSLGVAICIALGLLAYTSSRAFLMAFTVDESLTFVYHVRASIGDILFFRVGFAPSNNHLLNTLLMKLVSKSLGDTEFDLRLPNVAAHAVYLLYSLLIVKAIHHDWAVVPSFVLLNVNPFLLDWFSLARGYGLALSLLMGSAFYCLHGFSTRPFRLKSLFLASIMGALSVTAALPFLDYYVALLTVSGFMLIWESTRPDRSAGQISKGALWELIHFGPVLLGVAFTVLIVLGPVEILLKLNEFYYGGTAGFWPDTVGSLLRASLYGLPYTDNWLPRLSIIVFVLVVFVGIATTYSLVSAGLAALTKPGPLFVCITSGAVAIALMQHYVLGTKFLIDRTAILFVPLFALSVVGWREPNLRSTLLGALARHARPVLLTICAILALVNLVMAANWSAPKYAPDDASTKQMMQDLSNDYRARHPDGYRAVLGVPEFREYSANFYRVTMHLDWLEPVEVVPLSTPCRCDYVYYVSASTGKTPIGDGSGQPIINTYPNTGYTLAVGTR